MMPRHFPQHVPTERLAKGTSDAGMASRRRPGRVPYAAGVQQRGAVLILHAFAEHAGRHERAMRRLAARGVASYAYDHRGHGRSPGRRAFVGSFDNLVDDALVMLDSMAAEESDQPLFLLGAGNGRSPRRARRAARPDDFSGLVLVGQRSPGARARRESCAV